MALDAPALHFLPLAASAGAALDSLPVPCAAWFQGEYPQPTMAQRLAWPTVARGEHLLLSAPTGQGKTLAAFLPILGQLLQEPGVGVQCLYVSPLKALTRDVGVNLVRAYRGLRREWPGAALLRMGWRTGDTAAAQRRRHLRRPPHLLLTTPESLAILLSQPKGRDIFRALRWVIIDELHALLESKRGVDLALSLERLEEISSPAAKAAPGLGVQRIGLSATCTPLEMAARFLVGVNRPCTIGRVQDLGALDLTIEPLPARSATGGRGFITRLLDRLEPLLKRRQTTLIFTNIRSLAERVIWGIRQRWPRQAHRFAVHHSALAQPLRRLAERRLKQGKLRAVVSSTSLELGVDIGSVDQVVFVHPPGGVVRLLQRVGRSGHGPGLLRRGLLLTTGPAELLEATVTASACRAGQLEPVRELPLALDVLCQHLVGLAMGQWRRQEETYQLVCRAWPFRDLTRADYDRCLDYLAGRKASGESWLPPRLRWEGDRFTLVHDKVARLLRRNLGTILAEEPRAVRLLLPQVDDWTQERRSVAIGCLDDGFADQLQPGDRFVLDGRCFEYRRVQEQAVLVDEALTRPLLPRWTGSGWGLSAELAQRLYLFRQRAAEALRDGAEAMAQLLEREFELTAAAQDELIQLFLDQERLSEIPGLNTLLIEGMTTEVGAAYCFHTPLNRSGNDALARVLAHRLERDQGWRVDTVVADLGFQLTLSTRHVLGPAAWRAWLNPMGFPQDLALALHDCPSLRERFARVATTGMMLLRQVWGRPRKVGGQSWAQRRLFDQIRAADPDFPFLHQAEAELRGHGCDAAGALTYLQQMSALHLRCRWLSNLSPFAAAWTQPGEVALGSMPEHHGLS